MGRFKLVEEPIKKRKWQIIENSTVPKNDADEIKSILWAEAANDPIGWEAKLNTYAKARKENESLLSAMKRKSAAYYYKGGSPQYHKAKNKDFNDFEQNIWNKLSNTVDNFQPIKDWEYEFHENYGLKNYEGKNEVEIDNILKGRWGSDIDFENKKKIGKEYYFRKKPKQSQQQSSLFDFLLPSAQAEEIGKQEETIEQFKPTPIESFKNFVRRTAQTLRIIDTPEKARVYEQKLFQDKEEDRAWQSPQMADFWNRIATSGEETEIFKNIDEWSDNMSKKYPEWLGERNITQYGDAKTTKAFQTLQGIASLGAIGILGANVIQGITDIVQLNKGLKGMENITSNLPKIEKILASKGIVLPKDISSLDKIKIMASMTQKSPKLGDILHFASMRPAASPIPYFVGQAVKFGDNVGKIVNISKDAAQILTVAGEQISVALSQLQSVESEIPGAKSPAIEPSSPLETISKKAIIKQSNTGEVVGDQTLRARELSDDSHVFHLTPIQNLKSIVKEGLVPLKNANFDNSKKGVYFSTDPANSEYVMRQAGKVAKNNVLIRIKTNGIDDYWTFKNLTAYEDSDTLNSIYYKKTIKPQYLEIWNGSQWQQLIPKVLAPKAGGQIVSPEVQGYIQKKGLDITSREPTVAITKDTVVKDVAGNKVTLPAGEEYTPYKLSNNQILLQDGKSLIIQKGQLQNVKAAGTELKGFMKPEEEEVETITKSEGMSEEEKASKLSDITIRARAGEISGEQHRQEITAINEGIKSTTKFSQYQLPGGTNYKETLIQTPEEIKPETLQKITSIEKRINKIQKSIDAIPEGQFKFRESKPLIDKRYTLEVELKNLKENKGQFKSSHWDEPNVIAHTRTNERTTPEGKKVLFIEELQSDWARAVREKGIRKDVTYNEVAQDMFNKPYSELNTGQATKVDDEVDKLERGVPFHPLLKNWQELALKKVLEQAVKGGYDVVSWTTGQQQADRYDLSKQIDRIAFVAEGDRIELNIMPKGTDQEEIIKDISMKELDNTIGKDAANKIREKLEVSNSGKLKGLDLKIGGEWAKSLYDKQIPSILKKLTKGNIENISLGTGGKHKKVTVLNDELTKKAVDTLKENDLLGFNSPREATNAIIKHPDWAKRWEVNNAEDLKILSEWRDSMTSQSHQSLLLTPEVKKVVLGQPAAGGKVPKEKAPEVGAEPPARLPSPVKLRQSIIAGRNIKGMPRSQLREITKRISGHYSISHRDITPEQLNQILTEVKAARPRRINQKKVITQQTEARIQELKQSLISSGEMTEGVYANVLGGMNISEPAYISKSNFITESQGKQVIKNMLSIVPVVRDEVAIMNSFEQAPAIGGEITNINQGFKTKYEGKPAKVNPLLDMHHYADSMEKQTGVPFGRQQEVINEKRLFLDKQVIEPKIKEITDIEGYKKIMNDKAALRRINDFVASQLPDYVKGKPEKPQNITAQEYQIANIISTNLKRFEDDVRYNRFYEWYDHNIPIPNAPESELYEAEFILETKGDKALREWLKGRSWGVIRSGYDIGEVVKPSIRTFRPRPGVPKGHLKTRENVEFQRYERDIIRRYFSYVRQMTYKTELAPEIKAFQTLWNNNTDLFEQPHKVSDSLSRYLRTVLNQREQRGPLETFLFTIYSQASRAIFLDLRKGIRNLFQNLAFYSSPEDFFRMRPLNPKDLEYFKTFVSQNKGIRRDLQMLEYKGVIGFRKLNELADAVNVMGRTDDLNRIVAFNSKLNSVKDAIRLYPDYATNPEHLRQLMIRAGFGDMEKMEVKHALEILATRGPEVMARYVAKAVTQKVHFLYERAQRSPAEQGDPLRIVLSNLLTFKKGYIQRQVLDAKKLFPSEMKIGSDIHSGRRSLRSIIGSIVLAAFVGSLYQKLTGDRRNPYRIDEIIKGLGIGGLATGTQDQINEFTRDLMSAAKGDRQALDRALVGLTRIGDTFVPFYDEIINILETYSDTYNLDKAVLRQIRGEFDRKYKPKKIKDYELRRSFSEKAQHALFGTDKARAKKKRKGSRWKVK